MKILPKTSMADDFLFYRKSEKFFFRNHSCWALLLELLFPAVFSNYSIKFITASSELYGLVWFPFAEFSQQLRPPLRCSRQAHIRTHAQSFAHGYRKSNFVEYFIIHRKTTQRSGMGIYENVSTVLLWCVSVGCEWSGIYFRGNFLRFRFNGRYMAATADDNTIAYN